MRRDAIDERFRPSLLYPLLFAAHPALALAAANPGQFILSDLLATVLACLLTCALVYAAVALALGRTRRHAAALLVLLGVAWMFYLIPLSRFVGGLNSAIPRPFVLTAAAAALISAALAGWILLKRPALEGATRALFVMSALVVSWASLSVWRNGAAAERKIQSSALVRQLQAPVGVKASSRVDAAARRDIYVIVLDEFANGEILKERFGFDNSAYEDSLRQLGFVVPRNLRSNYSQTLLSLPSLLNFAHMTGLEPAAGGSERSYDVPRHLIEHNRTARFLKERGYRFVFFPSGWWRLTLHNPHADEEFRAFQDFDVRRELFDSEFRRTFVMSTLLSHLDLERSSHLSSHVLRTFDALGQLPARREPTFAFAHVLAPHWPYVLDAQCRAAPQDIPELAGEGEAYLAQVRCVQTLTLRLARQLLKESAPQPIIVIQGDHGTKSLHQMELDTLPGPEALRERFGAFGAYYLPEGGDAILGEHPTLVNILGGILSHYFGADVRPQSDALYFSSNQEPFRLLPVHLSLSAHSN